MLRLNVISPSKGSKRVKKRICRGIGSGFGKTGGRGHKGHKSRSGYKMCAGFEGGQTPLHRRLPKFGFRSIKKMMYQVISLSDISTIPEKIIDVDVLKRYNIIKNKVRLVKIIMPGEIKNPVVICNLLLSKGVREAIQNIGGCIRGGSNNKSI